MARRGRMRGGLVVTRAEGAARRTSGLLTVLIAG